LTLPVIGLPSEVASRFCIPLCPLAERNVMRGRMLALAVLLVASASFAGCNQQPQPTPAQTAMPESNTPEVVPTATPKPSPSATATVNVEEERQVLAGGEGWAFYEGDVSPFEANRTRKRWGPIGLDLSSDKYYVDSGETVRIRFTAINDNDETEVIEPKEGPILDILITYHYDRIDEWWSEGREIPPEMKRIELDPGESITLEMLWIPPDIGYGTGVPIFGKLRSQYGEQRIQIGLCIEDGCTDVY